MFDYELTDLEQFKALLRLGDLGGLQWLRLEVSDADFPIISKNTGKNILQEEAEWIHDHRPITLVAIDFGDLSDLSPWRVSGKHTKETGPRGTPLSVREALQAVEGDSVKQRATLPEKVFIFSPKGQLEKIVGRPLLDKDKGQYRMFAVLLKDERGRTELHLPLSDAMRRKITDYSEISLFDFTLEEFAQNAVLLPDYFAKLKKEIEEYLNETDKEALQFLQKELEIREHEEDDRDLPKDKRTITGADVDRYTRRSKAGIANMQYKLASCHLNGWGVKRDVKKGLEWLRLAAEKGHESAQVELGCCYYFGEGVKQDNAKAYIWLTKAKEMGNEDAKQFLLDHF